jgi:hypothetical protein
MPFSLENIPVPTHTKLGRPITKGFKYRLLTYNADTQLAEVEQVSVYSQIYLL